MCNFAMALSIFGKLQTLVESIKAGAPPPESTLKKMLGKSVKDGLYTTCKSSEAREAAGWKDCNEILLSFLKEWSQWQKEQAGPPRTSNLRLLATEASHHFALELKIGENTYWADPGNHCTKLLSEDDKIVGNSKRRPVPLFEYKPGTKGSTMRLFLASEIYKETDFPGIVKCLRHLVHFVI
jgi:hypothetical protein